MTMTFCIECGKTIKRGSRCSKHRTNSTRSLDGKPFVGWEWQRRRQKALERDGYRCVRCGAPATKVHHIRWISEGGDSSLRNLASVCDDCHLEAHGGAYRKAGLSRGRKR